ncbi:PAS domain-containing protein [Terribacillus saccharophilus]|uniref:STAS domain-containing protein n=1 Tax=Terribacillus saccharophilus TaxID=361277 RepID=UPI003D2D51BD
MIEGLKYSNELKNQFIKAAIDRVGTGVVITDPSLPDNPIIYVNEGFEEMSGYTSSEMIGRNCRFLQGKETNPEDVNTLRKAIKEKRKVMVEILNYKKNGEQFWNELEIYPIYLESEDKTFFIGVQKDVTERKKSESEAIYYLQEVGRLSTPIVPITDNVSVLPLIGNVDEHRINQILENVANHVYENQEDYFLLDLLGINQFDSLVHAGINKLYHLLKTMGTKLVVTGISPEIAMDSVKYIDNKANEIKFYSSVKLALKDNQNC